MSQVKAPGHRKFTFTVTGLERIHKVSAWGRNVQHAAIKARVEVAYRAKQKGQPDAFFNLTRVPGRRTY